VFGRSYADAYDAIYADKDYAGECDLVETVLRRHHVGVPARILDLGCGTGRHAVELARRGHQLVGVDRSADMIALAERRSAEAGVAVRWEVGDVRSVSVGGVFDAALLMFAVLGYQTSDADALAVLRNARRHLRDGGVLVLDVWYGVAVQREGPSDRMKVLDGDGREILRAVSSTLVPEHEVIDVRIRTWSIERETVRSRSDEVHRVRYFFPEGLRGLLGGAGFEVASLFAFPDLDAPPDPTRWSLGCVAVASRTGTG
jgi:SAM-dependent methyltransferase